MAWSKMSRTIKINTIKDIVDNVDDNNVENFIKDFSDWLRIVVMAKKLDPTQIKLMNSEAFTWIDDGKHNVIVRFHQREE